MRIHCSGSHHVALGPGLPGRCVRNVFLYRFLLLGLDEASAFDPLDVIREPRMAHPINLPVFCFGGGGLCCRSAPRYGIAQPAQQRSLTSRRISRRKVSPSRVTVRVAMRVPGLSNRNRQSNAPGSDTSDSHGVSPSDSKRAAVFLISKGGFLCATGKGNVASTLHATRSMST